MAFPQGADINAYKEVYMSQLDSSSSSDSDDELANKIVLLAKETKGKNKKIVRFDRQIAELELKQRNTMVHFNELERQLKLVRRDRAKAVKRLNQDTLDSYAKAKASL